jgi:hypothetical protein
MPGEVVLQNNWEYIEVIGEGFMEVNFEQIYESKTRHSGEEIGHLVWFG